MKKFLLLLLLASPFISKATHLAGEEMYYSYIGNNTYRIYLAFYATCKGANYDFMYSSPDLKVYAVDSNNASPTLSAIHLSRYNDGLGDSVDVSPYCPTITDNCNNPSSTFQGYIRYAYAGTVQLPHTSSKWYFWFKSEFQDCGSFSARNTLTNYNNPSHDDIVLYCTLNNSTAENTSPKYNANSKFNAFCPTVSYAYTQASTDSDNDSLDYNFVLPYYMVDDNCGQPIQQLVSAGTYTYLTPLPGTQTLNHKTGELDFNAGGVAGNFLVAFRISEYRAGVLVGTSTRERIFVLNSSFCGTPAIGHIDTSGANLHGALAIGQDTLTTCSGGVISFHVPVSDAAADTISIYLSNTTTGSSATISNNNTTNPVLSFNWNTGNVPNGVYTITAVFNTKSCPLPSIGNHTYTIIIGDGGTLVANQVSKTNCISKAKVVYHLSNGFKPYTLAVMQGSTVLNTYTDNTGTVNDSLAAGSYTLKLTSTGLPCSTIVNFVVADSGIYPYGPTGLVTPVHYCRNQDAQELIAVAGTNATLKWYDPTMANVPPTPTPVTTTGGTFYWFVSQVYKTCESEKDTIQVNVDQDECNFDVKVHNVITPNGDGKNDKWVVDNLALYPNTIVQVFDKLGDKVYEESNYQNDWEGGTLPSGMYYYVVNLSTPNKVNGKSTYTGYLMIKKIIPLHN